MKKIIIPTLIISAILLTASCDKKKAAPTPSISPSFAVVTPSATSTPKETDSTTTSRSRETSEKDNSNAAQSGSISIINGTSEAFYAVHLSQSNMSNIGENIIGDSPLGEGEEISLPFENASPEEMSILVEDESGRQYSVGGIYLSDGLTIELRIENGALTAVTQ